jgi:hypothetical protein
MKLRNGFAILLGVGVAAGGMAAQGQATVPVQDLSVVQEEGNIVDPQMIDEGDEGTLQLSSDETDDPNVRPYYRGYRTYYYRSYNPYFRPYGPYRPYYRSYYRPYARSYYRGYRATDDQLAPNGEEIPQPQMDQ